MTSPRRLSPKRGLLHRIGQSDRHRHQAPDLDTLLAIVRATDGAVRDTISRARKPRENLYRRSYAAFLTAPRPLARVSIWRPGTCRTALTPLSSKNGSPSLSAWFSDRYVPSPAATKFNGRVMPEHRFSAPELDVPCAVLDHCVGEIDQRLGYTQTYPIDTTALRIAKQDIVRVRSKLFPRLRLLRY